jgi:nucleotide-binding universal stress UspA family protein
MTRVIVPVRYPLSTHSERTLRRAMDVAEEEDAELTVLHVNLYQNGRQITRRDLKSAVEAAVGSLPRVRYVIREGFLVEETILDEVAAEGAEVVVIGRKQVGRWRSTVRRLIGDPDIEAFLREGLDCRVVTAD